MCFASNEARESPPRHFLWLNCSALNPRNRRSNSARIKQLSASARTGKGLWGNEKLLIESGCFLLKMSRPFLSKSRILEWSYNTNHHGSDMQHIKRFRFELHWLGSLFSYTGMLFRHTRRNRHSYGTNFLILIIIIKKVSHSRQFPKRLKSELIRQRNVIRAVGSSHFFPHSVGEGIKRSTAKVTAAAALSIFHIWPTDLIIFNSWSPLAKLDLRGLNTFQIGRIEQLQPIKGGGEPTLPICWYFFSGEAGVGRRGSRGDGSGGEKMKSQTHTSQTIVSNLTGVGRGRDSRHQTEATSPASKNPPSPPFIFIFFYGAFGRGQ